MAENAVACACGQPLHYSDPATQRAVEGVIRLKGDSCQMIITPRGKWRVPIHYIALHGLSAPGPAGTGRPSWVPEDWMMGVEKPIEYSNPEWSQKDWLDRFYLISKRIAANRRRGDAWQARGTGLALAAGSAELTSVLGNYTPLLWFGIGTAISAFVCWTIDWVHYQPLEQLGNRSLQDIVDELGRRSGSHA